MAEPVYQLEIDTDEVERGIQRVNTAIDHLGERMEAASAKARAAMDQQARAFQAIPPSIDKVAASYDRLRGKLDPVLAAQMRYEREMVASLGVINNAVKLGVATEAEAAATIARLKAQQIAGIEAVREAQQRLNSTATPRRSANDNAFNTANIAAQFQDVAVTSAMGMSPLQIALQQGTQLSAALGPMGAAGAVKSLGAAFASLVNPVSLVTIALVGAAAAAIQYFTSSGDAAESIDDLLSKHQKAIDELGKAWGKAADSSTDYGKRSSAAVQFGVEQSVSALAKRLREEVPNINAAIGSATNSWIDEIGGARAFRQTELFNILKQDIDGLVKSAASGAPDVIGLTRRLEELGKMSGNTGIRGLAGEVSEAIAPVARLAQKVAEVERELARLFNTVGPHGFLLSQGLANRQDQINSVFFENQEAVAAQRARQAQDAEIMGIYARTPGQKAAAARASEAASFDESESAAMRSLRIELAGTKALIEAEYELSQARQERFRSYDRAVAQAQLDLDLVGRTAGEQERLQQEFALTSQLREEAARTGIAVDEQELAVIREKAAELGRIVDLKARAQLGNDLLFERDQMFRSDIDQRIASTMRGAGLEVDFNSQIAGMIRLNEQLRIGKDLAQQFASTFIGDLMQGKSVMEALINAAGQLAEQLLQMAMNALIQRLFANLMNTLLFRPTAGGFASMLGMANGGAFDAGNVIPFARGGVVDSPTLFPFAKGVGLMGEAGPEAIMPLRRDAAGRLGVMSAANDNAMFERMMSAQLAMVAAMMRNFGGGADRMERTFRFVMPDGWRTEIVDDARTAARDDTVEILNERDKDFNRKVHMANEHPRRRIG